MKQEKKILCLLIACAGVVLLLTVILLLSGKKEKKKTGSPVSASLKPTASIAPTGTPMGRAGELYLVNSVDVEQEIISLHGFHQTDEVILHYSTRTEFRDKYGTLSSAYAFHTGDLVTADFDKENSLSRMYRSAEHWELHGIDDFTILDGMLRVNDVNYRLTERTVAFDEDGLVALMEVKEVDRIQLYGLDSEILAIEVLKGHGFIELVNCENYQGAKVTFGGETHTLTGEPSYMVREGTYQVTVVSEKDAATVSVTVGKNEKQSIDLYEYGGKPLETAQVRFHISPFSTSLTIDGEKQDYYEKELTIPYGTHRVVAELGGYVTYKGDITISKAYQSFSIDLVEKKVPTEAPAPTETPAPTKVPDVSDSGEGGDGSGGSGSGEGGEGSGEGGTGSFDSSTRDLTGIGRALELVCDDKHHTFLLTPVGAKVKLEGVSIGEAPLQFEKIIGEYTVTISYDGKEKSFPVVSVDDQQDMVLSFSMD